MIRTTIWFEISATGGENGNPQCYGGPVAPNDNPDRMLLAIAIINCLDDGPLNGNEDDVPTIGFAKVFLTEPGGAPLDMSFYLEIVDVVFPGDPNVEPSIRRVLMTAKGHRGGGKAKPS